MKGELILTNIKDELVKDKADFEMEFSNYDFALKVYIDENIDIDSQLKNREKFDKCMDFSREVRKITGMINEDEEKGIQYIENNFDNLLDSIEYVTLYLEDTDIKEFINNNKILLTKKIVLDEQLDIKEYDKLILLMNEYKDYIDKMYIRLIGNNGYVSLIDCYKTMNLIKEKANSIKELNLSPMETVMYTYDQVRNRVYKFEDENESKDKSRDLSEVLFGDKIVCLGYARIFSNILYYLGIDSYLVHLESNKGPGHSRNMVYIQDDKYDIDGVYYFDPTFDSKRKEDDNSYLYTYKSFAKTRKYMDKQDKKLGFNFKEEAMPVCSKNMVKKFKEMLDNEKYDNLLDYAKSFNYMSLVLGHGIIVEPLRCRKDFPFYKEPDYERLSKIYKEMYLKFNSEIPAETMIEILYNVRKVEHEQDPNWYLYSLDDLYKTFRTSDWKFEYNHYDSKTKLLSRIFGEEPNYEISLAENFKNFALENNMFEDKEKSRTLVKKMPNSKIKFSEEN